MTVMNVRRRLIPVTAAAAATALGLGALTACSSDPDKRCVDRDSYTLGKGYQVVADKNCKSSTSVRGTYYYGGKKNGSWVSGGSFTKKSKGSGSSSSGGGSGGSAAGGWDLAAKKRCA